MGVGASAQALRSAAAVLVLVDGRAADLTGLCEVAGAQATAGLRGQLCEGPQADRVRAMSAILTATAIDLADWGLR